MLEVIILVLSIIVNSILGLAVLIKNSKKDLNRLFFLLSLSLSLWLAATYLSLNPVGLPQLTWVRIVLASASILCYFVLTSFAIFPDGRLNQLRFYKLSTLYLIFVVALTQSPFVFKTLEYSSSGDAQPVVAPGIIFFMTLVLSFLGGALWVLFIKFKAARGQLKNQLRTVIFGIATSFAGILITNFFLVSVFKNTSFIIFAPLLTLILTGAMAYSILRHKLFDLRPAIARTLAYVLTLSLIVVIYSALAFWAGEVFSFRSSALSTIQRFFYVSLAVVTALLFQPLKVFFDRTTNRIFFRDAYDPQEVLDDVSNILVRHIRLEEILSLTSKSLMEHVKTVSCGFLIDFKEGGFVSLGSNKHNDEESNHLGTLIKNHHKPLIVTDDLPYNSPLREVLSKMDYGSVLKLSTHSSTVGYMLIGNKKSGEMINEVDVNMLGIVADELAIAVENALRFKEIEQFNLTLRQKVEDATKELRRANLRLKELDKTKNEFISMASHQLRTPLTTIKGYLSMILDGDVGKIKAEQKDMVQQAFDSAQNMVDLIADLLNVSRLQSGKFVIENKPTDLADMVEREIKKLTEQAAIRNLKLIYDKPASIPILSLDAVKMRQVVMNFIDNAIYYTPPGGSIRVALTASPHSIEYTVTDTGVGVPASVQHHLFSKFYRAANAKKMRPDGTGLGLFMAKKVIVAQGGALIFKSVEGKGSTFGFSFPRRTTEVKK